MKTNKLIRVIGLTILFIVLYILGSMIIPSIVWLFGGSFLTIIQSPAHIFISIFIIIGIGILFEECIDGENYHFKD